MKDKNNGAVILLLVVIVVILLLLCILFATNVITFNVGSADESSEDKVENDGSSIVDDISDISKYQVVIDQYLDIVNGSYSSDYDLSGHGYVYYDTYSASNIDSIKNFDWKYALYDINNDGTQELLIGNSTEDNELFVDVIYTYDGNKVVKVDNYMSRDYLYALYDNGYIVGRSSGGASVGGIDFTIVDKDFSIVNKSCTYEFADNKMVSSCDGVTSNYESIDDMILNYVKSSSKIDINGLNWEAIN